uniref:Uncharacterized protein n=1 Tax=Romanomermis culicivorax TaxID=13658 RepID=A0A915IXB8_ROMCU
MDFGRATFVLSKYRKSSLLKWESLAHPNHYYFFQKTGALQLADGSTSYYYECRNCDKIGGSKGRTTVRNNRVVKNPDAGHNELCAPMDEIEAETIILRRTIIKRAENGAPPLRAYRESLAEIRQQHDQDMANQVQLSAPAFRSMRSSLYRARNINLSILEPNNTPIEYQHAWNGRQVFTRNPTGTNSNERFLLINDNGLMTDAMQCIERHVSVLPFWHPHSSASVWASASSACGHFATSRFSRQGLMPLYEVKNSDLKKWIGLVKALAYMPPDLVVETWQKCLINPLDRSIRQNLLQFQEFIAYFEETWVNGIWCIEVLNYFDNQTQDEESGLMTRNHAEGWHNQLNHNFGHPQPALNNFLH